jgi:hypothetical protein
MSASLSLAATIKRAGLVFVLLIVACIFPRQARWSNFSLNPALARCEKANQVPELL